MNPLRWMIPGLGLAMLAAGAHGQPLVPPLSVDWNGYRRDSGVTVRQQTESMLQVTWPIAEGLRGELLFNLATNQPLIQRLCFAASDNRVRVVATQLDPVTTLTIGQRDKAKANQAFRGMVFFENPRKLPYEVHPVVLTKRRVALSSSGNRTTVAVGDVSAGSFSGELQFTFYRMSPLVLMETVVSTTEDLRAILYDTGLAGRAINWNSLVWIDPAGETRRRPVAADTQAAPLAVKYRALAAEAGAGALAIFPAPHQYFYPLDFANNYQFTWYGHGYGKMPSAGFGFGIRQPPEGDERWVPWVDAPAGTKQRLGVFYLLGSQDGAQALADVARYTRGDRFKPLPGFRTFTSHYHVEHTVDFLKRQKEQNTDGIPRGLETPGFVTKFKETGVEVVHLAEFHFGWTPGQKAAERLSMLKKMHEECARLSDDSFLLLPGEEPNVHLGGHWISFFPRPVYWVLNRGEQEPFVEEIEGYGTVYRVGNAQDVLALMEREEGLMWTAHARIKSSRAYPDGYRDRPFYKSDRFLGAAWKAMPADLSRPTLGWRVLDLLDDMNQWGERKHILGEVDVFRVEPDYELYAHMNVNYLKLERLPRFSDGWQPILDVLRQGRFFTTTGEVLIPEFSVGGRQSGDALPRGQAKEATVQAQVEWTFPLAFAEVVSGDGRAVTRHRVELHETESFGSRSLELPLDLSDQKWVRLEAWDIAANGAFTQPVWIE